ncbi:MAG: HAMP domain-containing histidine kinase [Cyanobacteria bacterium SID2]|nr:HAMP domain-containing histidine kinase [Cyanobacteria bacterium SID2]MBP0004252.1 HAMP domain-containing histidine kinase [Cyanobacteria bacterium SBC]
MFGPTSFRRILLSRILLLSVPVLLIGQYVTYRKARSSLLETARQNLTESAIRKGNSIEESVNALKVNLKAASEAAVLKSGSPNATTVFLNQLVKFLPPTVQCLQLTDLNTNLPVASTCDREIFEIPPPDFWSSSNTIYVTLRAPKASLTGSIDPNEPKGATYLTFSAPVYTETDGEGSELRYTLSLQSVLYQPNEPESRPGSLTGATVVIDSDGSILEHPMTSRVGLSVDAEADAKRLRTIINSALAGRQDFQHLFSFSPDREELLAGYTAIPSPVSLGENNRWIVLAVTRLDDALVGLEPIRQVMLNLVLGLLAANLIATLYLARDLARPVEQLDEYARNVECNTASDPIPASFSIQEFNQLSKVLNHTIERLKSWAQELESAWQESKAANQLKSEFLTTISHELRTPLNGIIGSIRLVRDGFCDTEEEEREFLQRADDAAVHLLDIINDILDISKIETGTLAMTIETVELRNILREAIELQAATLRDKGLELILFPEGEQPIWVRADPAKLKQVALNTIGNAIKFTEAGQISISTQVLGNDPSNSSEPSPTKQAVVKITDTGIGIDAEDFEKLFRPFVMLDGSRTRRFGGTGLGLAISRNLMEMMGGSIELHSDGVGCGTTVTLTLLATQEEPPSSQANIESKIVNSEQ